MRRPGLILCVLLAALAAEAEKQPGSLCIYIDGTGKFHQVNSAQDVPERYRAAARCLAASEQVPLAKPEEIELDGSVRRVTMTSPVGKVDLRWPRKVERLFGRTPERAMADAARSVSRALRSASFPKEVRNLSVDWSVVFLDEDLPEKQIPGYLIDNCHPGWMTPPANIYVVAQRVAGGCGGRQMDSREADAVLAEVLIHEMGHVVEFELLGRQSDQDRMRAEGFATWFTQFAADYSLVIGRDKVKNYQRAMAKEALRAGGRVDDFRGSAHDYAKAALFFSAIVERRGVGGLAKVYAAMSEQGLGFMPAVRQALYWDENKLGEEAVRVVK